jgi:hypothetical protein
MNNKTLLRQWEYATSQGVLMKDFARSMGLSMNSARSRIFRERKKAKHEEPLPEVRNDEFLNIEEVANRLEVTSKSKRIKTLSDLIAACQIDPTKWKVARWKANKWEVGVKVKHGDDVSILVEPLFQIEATLEPLELIPSYAVVQPMDLSRQGQRPKPKPIKSSGRCLIVPDAQIGFRRDVHSGSLDPFHDRRAMDVILQIAETHEFDEVIYLGDFMDFNEWSDKFLREPSFYFTTQPAVMESHWWLKQFTKALPKATHKKLEGNHEFRLASMMITHLMAAYGLKTGDGVRFPVLSVQNLLGLDKLGIEYIGGYPNNQTYAGCVRVIHGDLARKGSTETVKALVSDSQETVIMGHIHKIEWASRTIKERNRIRTVSAFSPGCLCRIDYVVPGHSRNQQWQQGAAVVEWDGDEFAITPIVIQDGRAIYQGRVYGSRAVLPHLNKDTEDLRSGWQF